ncbi:hypothetical protein BV185P1_00047 [Phocaeicola phage BV185P1]|nr:hypothetical protein BV185P1_00047 [Phocaeicola phage BV185P1]
MKITYINTGNSVGNETNYVAPIVIPIAAGLKQELLFEGMTDVAYMTIEVSRNGTPVHNQRLTPSSTARIDLSTFAQVLPSLNELYKNLESNPSSNVQDKIKFVLLDGLTLRTYTFYVCSLNCPYLNSRGWVHHDERNLVSTALASMVDVSLVNSGGGTKELVTDPVFGTGTKIKGKNVWVANLPVSSFSVAVGVETTMSIYVDNVGSADFNLIFSFGNSQDVSERIPVGFRGRVSKSLKRNGTANYEPLIWVNSPNAPMEANFYCFMLNYGSEPKPWIKAEANAASPCVGAMTDYRSGKLFDTRQVVSAVNTTKNLDLTGERRYARMYYSVGDDPALKDHFLTALSGDGKGSAPVVSGGRLSEVYRIRLVNSDGSVYGWTEYENKLPKDVSPNCGVLLRWLNSKGLIDSMFFEKYSIKPVMRTNNGGGNGIDYYETTVQIDVNWDNEPCLNWIQRSSDIIARIPIDVCQFGRATLLATNVFQTQGGDKTKTIQFKFKVQIVEP